MSKFYKISLIVATVFIFSFSFFCYNHFVDLHEVKNSSEKTNKSFQVKSEQKLDKPIEEITSDDVIMGEPISSELQERIKNLINQSQIELDKYRSLMDHNYKRIEARVMEVKKDVNNIYDFRDEIEANLNIAKWMIISLSSGILCLTTIILVMWRGVVNVNRKDVEVLFSIEKMRRELKNTEEKIHLLEMLCNQNEKD